MHRSICGGESKRGNISLANITERIEGSRWLIPLAMDNYKSLFAKLLTKPLFWVTDKTVYMVVFEVEIESTYDNYSTI